MNNAGREPRGSVCRRCFHVAAWCGGSIARGFKACGVGLSSTWGQINELVRTQPSISAKAAAGPALCSETPGVESPVSAVSPCRLPPRTRESWRQRGPAVVLQRLPRSLARSPAGGDGTAARPSCSEQGQYRPRVPQRLALLSRPRGVILRGLGVSVPSWVQVSGKRCPLRQGCCAEVSADSPCGWSRGRVPGGREAKLERSCFRSSGLCPAEASAFPGVP